MAAVAGQILGYVEIEPGVFMLFNPPQVATNITHRQVLANVSSVSGSPNVKASWLEASNL